MTRKNEQFTVRKNPRMVRMVEKLMHSRGFVTYSELFRALVREAWERLGDGVSQDC